MTLDILPVHRSSPFTSTSTEVGDEWIHFLPPNYMSSPCNELRLFSEGRMHPHVPEHAAYINSKLAALKANPETKAEYEKYKDLYDAKIAPEDVDDESVVDTTEEVPKKTPKKKKGRPAKSSTTTK